MGVGTHNLGVTNVIVWARAGLDGDLKKAMKDGKPVIIEVCPCFFFSKHFMLYWKIYKVFTPVLTKLVKIVYH